MVSSTGYESNRGVDGQFYAAQMQFLEIEIVQRSISTKFLYD
jgi:hypothetical protein